MGPKFRVAGDTNFPLHENKSAKDLIVYPKEDNFDLTLNTTDPNIGRFRKASDAHYPMLCEFGSPHAARPEAFTAPGDETAASPSRVKDKREAYDFLQASLDQTADQEGRPLPHSDAIQEPEPPHIVNWFKHEIQRIWTTKDPDHQ